MSLRGGTTKQSRRVLQAGMHGDEVAALRFAMTMLGIRSKINTYKPMSLRGGTTKQSRRVLQAGMHGDEVAVLRFAMTMW